MKTLSAAVLSSALALSGLAEDAYIESDGTQAIRTDYVVKSTTKIVFDYQLMSVVAQARLFGDYVSGDMAAELYVTGGSEIRFGYGNAYQNPAIGIGGNTARHTATIDFPNRTWAFDDKGGTLASTTLSGSNDGPLIFFSRAQYADGTVDAGHRAKMRLYSVIISESGVPVREYVPCTRGGVVGLYDRIGKKFLANYSYGATGFVGGGDIPEIPDTDGYIEACGGSSYSGVNTRHFFGPKTKVVVDFMMLDTTNQRRVFGIDKIAAGTCGSFYVNGSGLFSFYVGDAGLDDGRSTGCTADKRRHTAVLDRKNNVAYLMTDGAKHGSTVLDNGTKGATTTTSVLPMMLFSSTPSATALSVDASYSNRIYRASIYEDDVPVHDYVPCVKGGVPGFKDLVVGDFVTAESVSKLSAGGDVMTEPEDGAVVMNGNEDSSSVQRCIACGYVFTSKSRVELDYALNADHDGTTTTWDILATRGPTLATDCIRAYYSSGKIQWRFGNNSVTTTASLNCQKGVRRTFVFDGPAKSVSFITSGYTNLTWSAADLYTTTASFNYYSLRVGAIYDSGSNYAPIRVYGLRIYENGVLVYDYRPYVLNGGVGLYDEATKAFKGTSKARCGFEAAGTIASDGKDDAFLEADGTQAINTHYTVTPNTKIEADFQYLNVVGQSRVFGDYVSGDMAAELYVGGAAGSPANFTFGYGNPYKNPVIVSGGIACDAVRHLAVIDFANKTCSFSDKSSSLDSSTTFSGQNGGPLIIFSRAKYADGTVDTGLCAKMRLYSFKIYESGVLKHHYLPYKNGAVVGLKDIEAEEDNILTDCLKSSTPFKVGGRGYGTDHTVFYEQPQPVIVPVDGTKLLSVYAPGAVSYQWYRDGEPLEDETGAILEVDWMKLPKPRTAVYTVKAKFDRYGVTLESESEPVTATMDPLGSVIFLR